MSNLKVLAMGTFGLPQALLQELPFWSYLWDLKGKYIL